MNCKKDTATTAAVGLVIGLAAGYIAGILTAPKSGAETRQDIKDATDKAVQMAQQKVQALQAQVSVLVDQAKSRAHSLTAQGKENLDQLVDSAKDAQFKAKAVLDAVRDGDADDPDLDRAVRQANEAKENLANFLKKN